MQKNILLILPRSISSEGEYTIPPVGILYVSSSLKAAGFNVYTLNLNLYDSQNIYQIIKSTIEEHDISIVGTGELVVNYRVVKEIIDTVKQIDPGIATIIGGGLVSHSPFEAMTLIPTADFGVIGEGEITICELVRVLEEGQDISGVNGLIYRSSDATGNMQLRLTPERNEFMDINEIPFPDYDGFKLFEMQKTSSKFGMITAGRSCPFRCTFCSHTVNGKYRQRTLDSIFKEIDLLVNKYNIEEIYFNDELFSPTAERLELFCDRIKPYNIKWKVILRLSHYINAGLLKKMKDSGCTQILYGLESADNRILKSMNKETTVDDIERVLTLTKESGIFYGGSFIFGDIAETMDTINSTLDWVLNHKDILKGYCQFFMIRLFPGSHLYKTAVKNGVLTDTVQHIKDECPIINISQLSDEEYTRFANYTLPIFYYKFRAMELNATLYACKEIEAYTYDWTCPECASRNSTTSPLMSVLGDVVACPVCGFSSQGSWLEDYIHFVDPALESLLQNYKCAIWGMGLLWPFIYENSDALKNPHASYTLVDISETRRKDNFFGNRTIYHPDYLLDKNIEVVICTVTYYEAVRRMAARQLPGAKIIWYLGLGLER